MTTSETEKPPYLSELNEHQKRAIHVMEMLRTKHVSIAIEESAETKVLDDKYEELFKPLFEKRKKILLGLYEPTEADLEGFEIPKKCAEESEVPTRGIPNFWLHTFLNSARLVEMAEIVETDHDCLKSLKYVETTPLESKLLTDKDTPVVQSGFKISFHFEPNDYFTNEVLTKVYTTQHVPGEEPDTEVINIEGTKIDWKKDKNLTVKLVKKKPSKRGKKKIPARLVEQKQISFFTYFDPYTFDKENSELIPLIEADFTIGGMLSEKIIPHAYRYFVGENIDDDDIDFDEDLEEDEDEDDNADD